LNRKRFPVVLAIVGAALALVAPLPPPAAGQNPISQVTTQVTTQATTLEQALARVAWDPAQRGALLVVDPANTRLVAAPDTSLAPPPRRGSDYLLRDVAPAFGRKLGRVGSVTVLAPTTMVVLNPKPGKPDLLAGLDQSERARYLLASFTSAQWHKIGAESGLGLGDLNPEQEPLFLSLLPDPLVLREYTVEKGAGSYSHGEGNAPDVTLTPAQRSQVRLRLNLRTEMYLRHVKDPSSGAGISGQGAPSPVGAKVWQVESSARRSRAEDYGVPLRWEAPNRLKPGHLPFQADALSVSVPLDGAATVGELIRRVGEATRLELYADARVATLPLFTRERTARAGDLLQGLCLALTSTFRRVGPAAVYVLTDDVEGIGTRHARLAEWERDRGAQVAMLRESWDKKIGSQDPGQYLRFAPGDPYALDAPLLGRLRQKWITAPPGGGLVFLEVPPSALGAAHQALVREAVADHAGGDIPVRGDVVQIEVSLHPSLLVPGAGALEAPDIHLGMLSAYTPRAPLVPSVPAPAAALALPASKAIRALLLAPGSEEEARRAVLFARARGFNQLWVAAPDERGPEVLGAAITAAGKAGSGLAVLAAVRLLRRSPAAAAALSPLLLERNVLGESASTYAARRLRSPEGRRPSLLAEGLGPPGEWLRPEAPDVGVAVKERLRHLAGLPGLAGLVLRDAAPPGFADPQGSIRHVFDPGADVGYAAEAGALRLQFLRQEGYDPVDLDWRLFLRGNLSLPFYPAMSSDVVVLADGGGMARTILPDAPPGRWNVLRYQAAARLLGDLRAAVTAVRPGLPLFIGNIDEPSLGFSGGNYERWYGSWDKAEALPRRVEQRNAGADYSATFAAMARSFSRRVVFPIAYQAAPGGTETDPKKAWQRFARSLEWQLKMAAAPGWDGLVLDMTALPVDQALALLAEGN